MDDGSGWFFFLLAGVVPRLLGASAFVGVLQGATKLVVQRVAVTAVFVFGVRFFVGLVQGDADDIAGGSDRPFQRIVASVDESAHAQQPKQPQAEDGPFGFHQAILSGAATEGSHGNPVPKW